MPLTDEQILNQMDMILWEECEAIEGHRRCHEWHPNIILGEE